MTNTEMKEKIINFYDSHELFTKPKGETFYISNIGTTKIGNDVKEAFQYSEQGKFVPFDTIYKCYDKILQDNKLTREWFETTFPIENSGRSCNYTTIGSIFEKLKIVKYQGNGLYTKIA